MIKVSSALIGQSLRALRTASGRTVAKVARRAGLSASQLTDIENGSWRASIVSLQRIATAMGTDLVEVVKDLERGNGEVAPVSAALSLDAIASAIVALPVKASKMEAVTDAVVAHAMRVTGDNQSAAARLILMERKAFVRRIAGAKRRSKRRP